MFKYVVSILVYLIIIGLSIYGAVIGKQNTIVRYVFIAVGAIALLLTIVSMVLEMRKSRSLDKAEKKQAAQMDQYK